jgi:hypothetical protein
MADTVDVAHSADRRYRPGVRRLAWLWVIVLFAAGMSGCTCRDDSPVADAEHPSSGGAAVLVRTLPDRCPRLRCGAPQPRSRHHHDGPGLSAAVPDHRLALLRAALAFLRLRAKRA